MLVAIYVFLFWSFQNIFPSQNTARLSYPVNRTQ